MPDVAKASLAARRLHALLTQAPPPTVVTGPTDIVGHVEFRDVAFSYPARPDAPVLRKMSLVVPAGKTLALVGQSGCGKSTVVALLERFYDALSGSVLIDHRPIAGNSFFSFFVAHARI